MKGTMIITMFGIIIFLIASFFTFFAFDKLVNNELICIMQAEECSSKMTNTFSFGVIIIITLLVMIIAAAYVMVKNVAMDLAALTNKRQKRG